VARALKRPQAYRAVGNALNKNPFAPKVSCHRVVLSSGRIGGFASGSIGKVRLLRRERVVIEDGRTDLKKFGYFFGK
jgi:methylated-DNA-[protein]-cysteine S-methyltransferase